MNKNLYNIYRVILKEFKLLSDEISEEIIAGNEDNIFSLSSSSTCSFLHLFSPIINSSLSFNSILCLIFKFVLNARNKKSKNYSGNA